jgi:putative phosphonate metabolism protein
MTRYAIYFAPDAASPLWQFGSRVIGYDAATGADVQQWVPDGMDAAAWHALTGEPRRYGFHATLKAPFRLAESYTEADLLAAVRAHAAGLTPFAIDLEVGLLDGFLALVPATVHPGIAALEHGIVEAFDRFRAPLNDAERQRRLRSPLTDHQCGLLERFGYPYVLDQFRFHMTLTGRLPEPVRQTLKRSIEVAFQGQCAPAVPIDRIAVFVEDKASFMLLAAFRFGTGASA